MKRTNSLLALLILPILATAQLKYVVYDFEGYDVQSTYQTSIANGGYCYGDVHTMVKPNSLGGGDMIAKRILQLAYLSTPLNNYGGFGKSIYSFTDLDRSRDKLSFYIFNPSSNTKDASFRIVLEEDDNDDKTFDPVDDDRWVYDVSISRINGWQLIEASLLLFSDANAGGNGIMDIGCTYHSILTDLKFEIGGLSAADGLQTYWIDMIHFSDGGLPHGAAITDLPPAGNAASCLLGAFSSNGDIGQPQNIPAQAEGYFNPPGWQKLCIVHWFVPFSYNGNNANNYPNTAAANTLIDNGYLPMITWEPFFSTSALTDPVQPDLNKINHGDYDAYIDGFADQLKNIHGKIYIRLMHEMNGNWYPWSLFRNGGNAAASVRYIDAFRRIVNRVRARGVVNVQWIWCANNQSFPSESWNNFTDTYPGDEYVDITGVDVYNNPVAGTPPWLSFRSAISESYYTIQKRLPGKPFFVCEYGCRERVAGEISGSETKSEWVETFSKELKGNFKKVAAIIAFSVDKEHDWRSNSSTAAAEAFYRTIWTDSYYTSCSLITLPLTCQFFQPQWSLQDLPLLVWETDAEKEGGYCEIERSETENGIYRSLGWVLPSFTMGRKTNYTFRDTGLSKDVLVVWYRIKITGKTGAISYSPVRMLVRRPYGKFRCEIISYPSVNTIKVRFSSDKSTTVRCRVIDVTGKSIRQSDFTLPKGVTFKEFPFHNYAPGIYFMVSQTDQGRIISTFIRR